MQKMKNARTVMDVHTSSLVNNKIEMKKDSDINHAN